MITALLTVGDTRVLYIVQIIIIKPFKIIIFKLCLNKKDVPYLIFVLFIWFCYFSAFSFKFSFL